MALHNILNMCSSPTFEIPFCRLFCFLWALGVLLFSLLPSNSFKQSQTVPSSVHIREMLLSKQIVESI